MGLRDWPRKMANDTSTVPQPAAVPPASGRVLVLDDDDNLRETLGAFVSIVCGREWLGVGSFAELVKLGELALSCELAILDINLGAGRESGIDAFAWLTSHSFRGRIAFLTGHGRSHPLVDRALRLGVARVFQKPIKIDQLKRMVEEADS